MSQRRFNKVFCLGPTKSGTSSLHKACLRLGLRSIHFGRPASDLAAVFESNRVIVESMRSAKAASDDLLKDISEFDVYTDIGPIRENFRFLDRQYPLSKFIYTDRDEKSWVASRRKHVLRNQRNVQAGRYLTDNLKIDERAWIENEHAYKRNVIGYFKKRHNDFLLIKICSGEGYEKLCPFLGFEILDEPFPWENRNAR